MEEVKQSIIQEMMLTLADDSVNGVFILNKSSFVYANKGFAKLFGYDRNDILNGEVTMRDLILPEYLLIVSENIRKELDGQPSEGSCKLTGIRANGERIYLDMLITSDEYHQHKVIVGSIVDVSDHVITKKYLEQLQNNYTALLENDTNGIFTLDLNGNILNSNSALERMSGYSSLELAGMHYTHLSPPDKIDATIKNFNRLLQEGKTSVNELVILKKDGSFTHISVVIIPMLEGREVTGIYVIASDISEKKQAEKEIYQAAFFDYLTNLPNRRRFMDQVDKQLRLAEIFEKKLAIFIVSVDQLNLISHSLGNRVSDELLKQIADRLQSILSEHQDVYRVSSDKFSVVFPEVKNNAEVMALTKVIFDVMAEEFTVEGFKINITVSMGISTSPKDGSTVESLYECAEAALYFAEKGEMNQAHVYSSSLSVQSFRTFSLSNDLPKALENNQLFLEYMPRVQTETALIVGVEALIRWDHPEWGRVSPLEFIPIAEERGLIVPIGQWVLNEACRQNKAWMDMGYPPITVSVNFSAKQLLRQDTLQNIDDILEKTGMQPNLLEIELTENIFISNETEVIQLLLDLSKRRIKVSLDDFGTGYSSLYALKTLKIDTLKIDKSFVQEATSNTVNQKIIQSIVDLAKALEMKVIAEGVETLEQYTLMNELQCDEIQGFYFSRPLSVDGIIPILDKQYLEHQTPDIGVVEPIENRRHYFRIKPEYPLLAGMTISTFKGKPVDLGSTDVYVRNIGPGGINFLIGIKLPVNDDIILKFTTEILGHHYEFYGNIVWFNEIKNSDVYEYGISFLIEEAEQIELVRNLNLFAIKLREGLPPHTQFFIGNPIYEIQRARKREV